VDLTPRTSTEPGAQPPARKRRWLPIVIVVGALLGGGVIVTQFITSAKLLS